MNKRSREGSKDSRISRTGSVIKAVVIAVIAVVAISAAGFAIAFPMISGMPLWSAPSSTAVDRTGSSVDAFHFRPGLIRVGTVYHYTKSNIDGTRPAEVSLYIAAPDRIEVFKIYPHSASAVLVTAEMDWRLFSPRLMESFNLNTDGSRVPVVSARLAAGDRYEYHASKMLWVKDKTTYTPVGHYPVHNYNFDLASLNFAFRHLVEPTGEFEFGVHMPWFDLVHRGRVQYIGKATVRYLGEESCHGRPCRKYSLAGQAFGDKQGYIWVNKEGGHFERLEMPVRDNPAWKDFRLELTGMGMMSGGEWEESIRTRTAAFLASR